MKIKLPFVFSALDAQTQREVPQRSGTSPGRGPWQELDVFEKRGTRPRESSPCDGQAISVRRSFSDGSTNRSRMVFASTALGTNSTCPSDQEGVEASFIQPAQSVQRIVRIERQILGLRPHDRMLVVHFDDGDPGTGDFIEQCAFLARRKQRVVARAAEGSWCGRGR